MNELIPDITELFILNNSTNVHPVRLGICLVECFIYYYSSCIKVNSKCMLMQDCMDAQIHPSFCWSPIVEVTLSHVNFLLTDPSFAQGSIS